MPAGFNFGELFKLLPFLGAAAGGYTQGSQMGFEREQARQRMGLAESEAARAAAGEERAAGLYPLQRQALEGDIAGARGRERRAQGEFDITQSPIARLLPPEVLASIARSRTEAGFPADPGAATGEQFFKAAGLVPSDPSFYQAKASAQRAQTGAASQREGLLARYTEIESSIRKAMAEGTPIDKLIEGRIRQRPEDAELLNQFDTRAGLESFLQQVIDKRRGLEGGGASPAVGGPAPAGGLSPEAAAWQRRVLGGGAP